MTAIILQFPERRFISPMERARRTALTELARLDAVAEIERRREKPQFPGGIDDMDL